MNPRLLIFHLTVPPYRVDFFNSLNEAFVMRFCGFSDHMTSQPFNYEKLKNELSFAPHWLLKRYNLGVKKIPKGIIKELSDFKPDIVMVSEYGLITILILLYRFIRRKSFKIVSLCDDSYNQIVDHNDFKWTHRFSRRVVAPFLDDIILVEPKVVEWYQHHYHKGLFFPIIRVEDKYINHLKSLSPVINSKTSGKNVFLFVGRLVSLKNVNRIIEAFSKLDSDNNLLVIVGDGPDADHLKRQASKCERNIMFTGRLEGDELLKWYITADCFILASLQEAFGAVTNEALLAGCWSLVSNRAGSRCLVEGGVNGYTFDPLNVDELAEKMRMSVNHFFDKRNGLRMNRMLWRYQNLIDNLVERLILYG